MMTAVRERWSQISRRWHAWRARLRRERAAVAIGVAFTMCLGEPLSCIIHCDLWLPLAFPGYFAAQQHLHHHHHTHAGAAQVPTPAGVTLAAPAESIPGAPCFHATQGDGVPFHVPPSPIHEVLPVPFALLAIVLTLVAYVAAPPGGRPSVFFPPPLRPPIPLPI